MIDDYFGQIDGLIAASLVITSARMTYDRRTSSIGFIRGEIYFLDGSLLHVREFVTMDPEVQRYMYACHYQRNDGTLIFRYDNSPHFQELPGFPYHRHRGVEDAVAPADPVDVAAVLRKIEGLVILPGA